MKLNRKVKYTTHTKAIEVPVVSPSGDAVGTEIRFCSIVVEHSPSRTKRKIVFVTPPVFVKRLDAFECAKDAAKRIRHEMDGC